MVPGGPDVTSETALYRALVCDAMGSDCAEVAIGARCQETVDRLRAGDATCVVVVDEGRRPVGIVTERDVVRRIAFLVAGDTPVADIMTAPVKTISGNEFLFHAIAIMRRADIRHVPVIDDGGGLVGVLRLKDALFETDRRLMVEIDTLVATGGIEGFAGVKAALPAMAGRLMNDGVPVPEIQALLTEVNNDLYRRIADLTLEEMAAAGRGPAPVDFSIIVMGSGGRGENFIHPDQDNGLILADYPDAQHNSIDAWFVDFSCRLTEALDRVGFPLCKGHVMATNPVWRKTVSQWKRQFDNWVGDASAVSLRFCDILFDFRTVWGNASLGQELRRHVLERVRANRPFLRAMEEEAEGAGVALGFFDRFILVRDDDLHEGTINLKQSGLLPLIEAVRIIALRDGVDALSTLGRMDALAEQGYLAPDEHDYLNGAYQHLCRLILGHQVAKDEAGGEVSYYVSPDALTRREKDMLVDGLKAIRRLRGRVRAELTGDIF